MSGSLAERYAQVRSELPPHVTLVAVSKMRSAEEVLALYDLGHRDFGENYVQELRAKQAVLPSDIRWHFIGHLQRTNVKHIVPFVHLIHGVDGDAPLDEIQKRAAAIPRTVDVLVQVHVAQEETKHGLDPQEARALIENWDASRWSNIRLRGLMGMATNTEDEQLISREFVMLSELHRSLRVARDADFSELSMGMTSDAELAVAAGSTMVRIGTAIFGARG